jgi:hypothetical protein
MQGGTKRKAATSKGRPKVNPQCCRNDRTGERYCARPAQKTTSRGQAESAQPFRQRGAAGKVFARPGAPVMIGIGAVEPAGSDQATDDTWSRLRHYFRNGYITSVMVSRGRAGQAYGKGSSARARRRDNRHPEASPPSPPGSVRWAAERAPQRTRTGDGLDIQIRHRGARRSQSLTCDGDTRGGLGPVIN